MEVGGSDSGMVLCQVRTQGRDPFSHVDVFGLCADDEWVSEEFAGIRSLGAVANKTRSE